jgi:osmotically inducible protein OsmC
LDVAESTVNASVDIGSIGGGGFGLGVTLKVQLPKLDQAAAQKLVEAAHQVCPYSNATRGNIQVTLSVVD